ncbi:PH domain-containing protein [Halalkaliarchaeum sp. AArc-GB]|uniref:PH domain-containing protein n=1 Tax=unclassified Halalkaliarchaeum TaxID=2678344 RepID=UPI00217DD8EC|nr:MULTISPECIES: PH domain-containing protein [unclassified Halalkaliarchaeum]MDR5673817.1 PH domain-containing protein [Halalkaliarchaeum sp. AArc-GB]
MDDVGFDWLTLEEDEEVLWSSRPHRSSLVPALIVGIPLSILLIGLVIILGAYLTYTNTNYVVTTSGLYKKTGILSRDVQKIGFDKVQNISYSQSAIGSYFGYGNVEVSTAGSSGVEMQFRSVPAPADVQELIDSRIERRDGRGGDDKEDVLAEILTELRTIRRIVEEGQDDNGNDEIGTDGNDTDANRTDSNGDSNTDGAGTDNTRDR